MKFPYEEQTGDGLYLAEDGECYTCNHGTFNPKTAECECSIQGNKASNTDGNGCVCASGYLAVNSKDDSNTDVNIGDCVLCDNTAPLFESFYQGKCLCKTGAVLSEDRVCECSAGYMFWENSCVPCADNGDGIASLVE